MWPKELPIWIEQDSRRSSEKKVYFALRDQLDDEWHVFYSRPWYGISSTGGEIEGEADFIVAHPDHGILFIEVKGGMISYDPVSSKWFSTDRDRIKFKIKDPIDQAKKCRYQFAKKLQSLPNWPNGFKQFRYGAIFTDTIAPDASVLNIGGHDKSLFCHSKEFSNDLNNWILNRLGKSEEISPLNNLGLIGINLLYSYIANPVTLRTTVGSNISNEIEVMDRLFTGAQLSILTNLDKINRGVVLGGAGTGKTLLATELAMRFTHNGLKTLVLSSSDPLVEDISRRMPKMENLEISKISSVNNYFDSSLKWDAIIIDEAQDVPSDLWDKVEGLLESAQSRIYAFLDSNQSIYRPPDDLSTQLNATSFELNLNLRNTKVIAKATELLYSGPLILAHGPEGEKPTCVQLVHFNDAMKKCISVVDDLVKNQNVSLGDICILVRDKDTREKVQYAFMRSGFPSTNAPNKSYNSLCIETIPLFKGLESNIVITLCDFELANNMEMSYVSLSRARSRFFLIGNVYGSLFHNAINFQE
jgi:hypothetical protein